MSTPVKPWHLIVLFVGVVGGMWLLFPAPLPAPPDYTTEGYSALRVKLNDFNHEPDLTVTSNKLVVIADLTQLIRDGQPVVVCRCAALGSMELVRPDGTSEKLLLMPAHDSHSVEVRVPGRGRYRLPRDRFLTAVQPLGIPARRWYKFPSADGK